MSMKESTDRQASKRLWSKQEDQLLCEVVALHHDLKWALIAEDFNSRIAHAAHPVKRTNKQCRERWQNHLNPQLRNSSEWSHAEHQLLFTLFQEYSHQWCRISAQLEQSGFSRRGDNHIKNYFYSSIKRAMKRINEVVRESNREIKRQKSILYHYSQKYAYKKRLSLERQILSNAPPISDSPTHEHPLPTPAPAMRIIKELDQDIISKILLIADQKGAKKFTITNKNYEAQAVTTRNTLIEYIKNPDEFAPQDVIQLTTDILELSRKCKRKNNRTTFEEGEPEAEEDQQAESQADHTPFQKKEADSYLSQKREENDEEEEEKAYDEEEGVAASEKAMAQEAKKVQPVIAVPERKNSQEDKNLLQRFLCEEKDQRLQTYRRGCSSEYSSSKQFDQAANSVSGFLPFGQQLAPICLDQSSYFYNSNCFSQRDNQPFLYIQPSNAYADFFDSQACFDPLRSRKEEDRPTNLAQFSFLSSIKEMQPKSVSPNMFDFDMMPAAVNPFTQGLLRNDSEQERLFASQVQPMQRTSSHRSNHSRSRLGEQIEQVGLQGMQCEQMLNRSWAYSSSRVEQSRQLCNSNNYEAARKNEFTVDLRNSNFYPFSKQ